jgi:hypothetical protein
MVKAGHVQPQVCAECNAIRLVVFRFLQGILSDLQPVLVYTRESKYLRL